MLRLSLLWTACLFLAPILFLQGLATRRRAMKLPPAVGPTFGNTAGSMDRNSEDIEALANLLVLGDSVVAGVGVDSTSEALPAQLANSISQAIKAPLQWRASGFNGDRLKDLRENLYQQAKLGVSADLVVINIGVNDVSGLTSLTRWQLQLIEMVNDTERLFKCPVVLVGLPPMDKFPLLPQPLRFALGTRAKMLDLSLANIAAAMSNVSYVALDFPMEPEFMAIDGYHPSAKAVAQLGDQITDQLQKEGVLNRLISAANV